MAGNSLGKTKRGEAHQDQEMFIFPNDLRFKGLNCRYLPHAHT